MTSHTPKPWTVGSCGDIYRSDGELIAAVRFLGGDNTEGKANSHLIAAAPDLLAELARIEDVFRNMVKSLNEPGRTVFCIGTITEGLNLNITSISGVIAKAKGDTNATTN